MKTRLGSLAKGFALTAVLAGALVQSRDAAACGGFFPPPSETPADVTDERMILSVSPGQTSLYSEIKYSGNPASFGWVLPIHGNVDVALSAESLFTSMDRFTATKIQQAPTNCPAVKVCPDDGTFAGSAADLDAGGAPGSNGDGQVTVTSAATVGPYATVQLHATDSTALEGWLADNNFPVSADAKPKIDAYVKEGFDFLAMKLLPGSGVETTRPIRVTTKGAAFSLPLRMASIGAHDTVGITLWIVSDGRYEPQNMPFFHVDDSALTWDYAKNSSNYDAVRASALMANGGSAWEVESSINLDQLMIGNDLANYPNDYLPTMGADPSDGGTEGGSPAQSSSDVQGADLGALFSGQGQAPRFTRLHGTLTRASMSADLVLRASADQAELSNSRVPAAAANVVCPSDPVCASNPSVLGGCRAAPKSPPSSSTVFAVLSAMIGLVLVRLRRPSS